MGVTQQGPGLGAGRQDLPGASLRKTEEGLVETHPKTAVSARAWRAEDRHGEQGGPECGSLPAALDQGSALRSRRAPTLKAAA